MTITEENITPGVEGSQNRSVAVDHGFRPIEWRWAIKPAL